MFAISIEFTLNGTRVVWRVWKGERSARVRVSCASVFSWTGFEADPIQTVELSVEVKIVFQLNKHGDGYPIDRRRGEPDPLSSHHSLLSETEW